MQKHTVNRDALVSMAVGSLVEALLPDGDEGAGEALHKGRHICDPGLHPQMKFADLLAKVAMPKQTSFWGTAMAPGNEWVVLGSTSVRQPEGEAKFYCTIVDTN